MAETLVPAPEQPTCSVRDCGEPATADGLLAFDVHDDVGAVDSERRLLLDLPLCGHHAHLLRMRPKIFELDSGD